jgi:hypothetical protein
LPSSSSDDRARLAKENTVNVQAEIDAGKALIAKLPAVLDSALIGSASYLPNPQDVDFAVLIGSGLDAMHYAEAMHEAGWELCSEYDGVGGTWAAVRHGFLNLMVTHDPKFFTGYRTAMEVCKALHLVRKEDRIAVCQIVRDGLTADQVIPWSKAPQVPPAP